MLEQKNEQPVGIIETAMLSPMSRLQVVKNVSDDAGRCLEEQARVSDAKLDVLMRSVAVLGQQVSALRAEVTDEVPSVTLVTARLDAKRGLLRCSCAELRGAAEQQLLLAKSCCDEAISKLDATNSTNLSRLLDKPMSKLWDDCQQLVNVSRGEVTEFMPHVRDQIMLDAANQASGCVRDQICGFSSSVRDDILEDVERRCKVQSCRSAISVTSDLKDQVASNDEALHIFVEMVSPMPPQNAELISDAVGMTVQQIVESGIISTAVCAELTSRPERVAPVQDNLCAGGRLPAASSSSPSSSGSLFEDEEACSVCGGLRLHAYSGLTCVCLLEEPSWTL
ncbi:unnamed protein product [Prorocentrum cordatum]|uniref:Uncharacterized protein n=1 Tax=Prorocentrum cordatum TaxID=2364126 RepID=A0ABN9SA14_9DINO|nr:unnamed protein product [Polarella glacialis]